MEYKDYYKIMGVLREAKPEEIKNAYRKLAKRYHPDVSKEPHAEAKFKELGEAYEVLKDPQKRAAYDQLGANWRAGQEFRPPPDWQTRSGGFHFQEEDLSGADFSDFFSSLFGAGQRAHHTRRRGARDSYWRGQDIHSKIPLTLEEAYRGTTRTLQLQMPDGQKALNVKIPAGVTQGQQIRLVGQGGPGSDEKSNGDLFLEIELQQHPFFQVDGKDIYLNLPLAPWEAALGTTVSVPTLGGTIELKIPAGSQTGQKLRLKERGLPGKQPGDQYVLLQIMISKPKTPADEELYRKLADAMPFNPREKLGV